MNRKLALLASAGLAVFCLGACATMDPETCERVDWQQIGRADGARGHDASYYARHIDACGSRLTAVNRKQYLEGREQGLLDFCSPRGGFEAGNRGDSLETPCPAALETEFRKSYAQGLRLRNLTEEKAQADADIRKLEEKEKDKKPEKEGLGTTLLKLVGLSSGESSEQDRLRERSGAISEKITAEEASAPAGTTSVALDTQVAGPAVAGAAIGTVFGFGSGHALQGRYWESGWVYTASQIGAISLMASAPAICGGKRGGCSSGLVLTGVLGLLTSKILESTDLWKHASFHMSGYSVSNGAGRDTVAQVGWDF